MQEIENYLNQLTEKDLVELENSIKEGSDLPGFIKEDFLDQITWNVERNEFA
jgi:hypothetical protein